MFKVLGFLTKKEGMKMQDFIDYYENKHVPLICGLAPIPSLYKRRYIVWSEPHRLDSCQAGDWTRVRACSSSNRTGER